MKLLFLLSGEHPDLPRRELECACTVTDWRKQVAIGECQDFPVTDRFAFTHLVMEYLGECGPYRDDVEKLLASLSLESDRPFAGRVKKVEDCEITASASGLERLIGSCIRGPVSLSRPEEEYRLVCSEDRCYLGRVIGRIDRGAYNARRPGDRPFFHPGVMMPRTARALVNLALVQPGETLLDPFCGTGGILIEGELLGARTIGMDMDRFMIRGCRKNIGSSDLVRSDAIQLPLRSRTIDAVVTDLPYGQSVSIRAETMEHLYENSLAEIHRVLKPGKRAVVVTHRDISVPAGRYFSVLQKHDQRVHKSLTRRILVLERTA
ncbi:MAG: methyltransferase domain-containing protein [Methanoregulaceae archaeon]